jgi:hypothetical protein
MKAGRMPLEYVACLTTIPSRIRFVHLTLNSLLSQTRAFDRIYLCIPTMSVRFQCAYEIPESLASRTDITILRCTDYGPATKVLGLLEAALPDIGPSTRIFYCDDDRIYDTDRSTIFYEASLVHPDSMICQATTPYWKFFVDGNPGYEHNSRGLFPAGKHLIQDGYVDIAEGFGGVVVQPRFFEKDVFVIPPEYRVVDDIWVSGHIGKQSRTIWGVSARTPKTHQGDAQDPLYLLQGSQERKGCNEGCIRYYQTKHSIWENIEAITLDQKLVVPTIQNVHRLLSVLHELKSPLKLTVSLDLPVLHHPDEYLLELETAAGLERSLSESVASLIPDCEMLSSRIHSYKTTVRYLTDAKLLTKESEEKLLAPVQTLIKEKRIKDRIESFVQSYTSYRGTVLRTSLFRARLLCHACKTRIHHYVSVPCGHLVCDGCKHPMCPVCSKATTILQPIAFS